MSGQIHDPIMWKAPITEATGAAAAAQGFPENFPTQLWMEQSQRYQSYWDWYSGRILSSNVQVDDKMVMRYPLQINAVRSVSRKHGTILIGEQTFDSPRPPIATIAKARPSLTRSKAHEQDKADMEQADLVQSIMNEIWADSNGRSQQAEAAVVSQFLGGWVWKVEWDIKKLKSHRLPITISSILPDFFLPIYSHTDPWNLLAAYVVYRIPAAVAREQYGVDVSTSAFPIYCEYWTQTTHSVFIDGKPIKQNGKLMLNVPHPYGLVPFVYVPHTREGGFYGTSIVADIEGLLREYNGRMANMGDIVRQNAVRRRYVVDAPNTGDLELVKIGGAKSGLKAYNLGKTDIATKSTPSIIFEDPPAVPTGVAEFPDKVWVQLMRDAQLSDIAFGEDEGSQRSALTLAFRMWPTTSHVRMERAQWTDGLTLVAHIAIKILLAKRALLRGALPLQVQKALANLDDDCLSRILITMDWLPMIPRDREQQVNEIIYRFQAGLLSIERAIEMYGDIPYVGEEIEKIKEYQRFLASLNSAQNAQGSSDKSGSSQAGKGAEVSSKMPAVDSGLESD